MPEASRSERVIKVADIDPRYRHALFRLFEHLAPNHRLQIVVDDALGRKIMIDSPASPSDVPAGDPRWHGKPSPSPGDGRLSRTERLKMFSFVAAAEMRECYAWIIPMLERSDLNEDPTREK